MKDFEYKLHAMNDRLNAIARNCGRLENLILAQMRGAFHVCEGHVLINVRGCDSAHWSDYTMAPYIDVLPNITHCPYCGAILPTRV